MFHLKLLCFKLQRIFNLLNGHLLSICWNHLVRAFAPIWGDAQSVSCEPLKSGTRGLYHPGICRDEHFLLPREKLMVL